MSAQDTTTTLAAASESVPGSAAQASRAAGAVPERGPAPPAAPEAGADRVLAEEEPPAAAVDLARVAWLVTVLACLLAVTILVLQGYLGYAGVTLAVALAAGINLF